MVTNSLTVLTTMATRFGIVPTNESLIAALEEELATTEDIGSEYVYVLPFIICFGLCGNVISLVAILHSRLRRTAANQYLIVLTAADCIFLLALSLIWAKFDFISYETCVLIEYVLQSSSYVSSWSISALTVERYMAIAHPLKHMRFAHVNRYKLMIFWVPVPFILNIVQFFVLTPPEPGDSEGRKCFLDNGNLQALTETADIVIGYLIPCMIVVVLNLLVASKVESADKGFFQKDKPDSNAVSDRLRDSRRQGRPNSSSAGSTRILLVVPVVYIILNTPFYLCRLVDTIAINIFGNRDFAVQGGMNKGFVYVYNTAYYLYYINFACDVIVYAFSSANFRKTVVIAWKRILCPEWLSDKPDVSQAAISRSLHKFSTTNAPAAVKIVKNNVVIGTQSMSPTSTLLNGENLTNGDPV
uniref:G-protein coupled receptors family 1 profile domain-containing protein n=1 Tax=Panagrolaimus sp. JU765 TaxID=591449 RepID=A0AC34QS01_9BILA